MLNNLKKRNKWLYLPILLLLVSCSKEDIPTPQPIPPSVQKEITPISFMWYYNSFDNPHRKIMNNDEKGDYGGGQAYSDVNADGYDDILVSHNNDATGYKNISWYINKGDNLHFNSDTTYINGNTFGNTAHKILKTEINKDGKSDFIILGVDERVVGNYSGNFNVLLSTPTNKFDFKIIPNPNKYWFHNGACGDLNNDGNVDVVTATFVWYGDGIGNFTKSNIELNSYTKAILVYGVLDVDGDKKNDIILGGNDMYGNTTIIFANTDVIKLPKHSEFIFCNDFEFLDLDSDGDLDMIELRSDKDQIQTKIFAYIKTPSGYSLDPSYFDDSLDGGYVYGQNDKYGWSTFKVDDMDKDGVLDIVAENFHDSKINGYKKMAGKWVKYEFN